jgi:lysyl-tRNA synthetase class 2
MDIEMLQERARIIRHIRSFFDGRDYLELDTPLLSPNIIPESCLEVFETRRILPSGSGEPLWLIPSPEIWMKKIIARHHVSVYQICKCFRNGESSGFLHSPEFTMLEYYTMNAGYLDSLKLTEELFRFLSPARFDSAFERITVAEAFARYADFDLFASAAVPGKMEAEARRLGLNPPDGMGTAELYDLIFIHAVEPQLKHSRPVALLDYPAFVPCLANASKSTRTGEREQMDNGRMACPPVNAAVKENVTGGGTDGKTVERWELYYNGIELANCFTEETDAQHVRDFFISEAAAKERQALVKHRVDHDYWKLFDQGAFPPCSGVALGLDRLIMAICGRSTIDSVLPFPI